jgi:uncharacterized protein (DUF4415 family)
MTTKKFDLEKIAKAIEADAGEPLEGLRESLAEAHAGKFAAAHTPEQIQARRHGRPTGSVQATTKEPVKLRLDADVLGVLRATGDGWQTRMLRASLSLGGKLPR